MRDTGNQQQQQPPKLTGGALGSANLRAYWRKNKGKPKQYNQHQFPGPHSRASALTRVDMRSREGLYIKQVRAQLTAQIGGNPTPAQQLLIERCAWISLRLALLDKKIASQMSFTLPDTNYYLAWANSLSRMLVKLGIELAAKNSTPQSSIDDIVAEGSK